MADSDAAKLRRRLGDLVAEKWIGARWVKTGFQADVLLMGHLLQVTNPGEARGASVATALDMWIAKQLRDAGLRHVLPRLLDPQYVGRPASVLIDGGVLTTTDEALASLEPVRNFDRGVGLP